MKHIISAFLFFCLINTGGYAQNFRTQQLKFPRVRAAFEAKGSAIDKRLKALSVRKEELQVFIRALKKEKELEVWVKNRKDKQYRLFETYAICASSGFLGPKRKAGDGQVPEGVYYIDRFNPSSNFHLSLGVSYPNESDRILGQGNLGGDIFIHGSCVTIGCLPMTNEKIEEIYCLAVEAKNSGQAKIPVHIFPLRLTLESMNELRNRHRSDPVLVSFWQDLSSIYQYFDVDHVLPASITVNPNGEYKAEPKKMKH
jgi:murein L,D-transpeptidase YafK